MPPSTRRTPRRSCLRKPSARLRLWRRGWREQALFLKNRKLSPKRPRLFLKRTTQIAPKRRTRHLCMPSTIRPTFPGCAPRSMNSAGCSSCTTRPGATPPTRPTMSPGGTVPTASSSSRDCGSTTPSSATMRSTSPMSSKRRKRRTRSSLRCSVRPSRP